MYDPQLGTWHVPDPMASFTPGISPYAYVYNNPISFIDPDGAQVSGIPGDFWERILNLFNRNKHEKHVDRSDRNTNRNKSDYKEKKPPRERNNNENSDDSEEINLTRTTDESFFMALEKGEYDYMNSSDRFHDIIDALIAKRHHSQS